MIEGIANYYFTVERTNFSTHGNARLGYIRGKRYASVFDENTGTWAKTEKRYAQYWDLALNERWAPIVEAWNLTPGILLYCIGIEYTKQPEPDDKYISRKLQIRFIVPDPRHHQITLGQAQTPSLYDVGPTAPTQPMPRPQQPNGTTPPPPTTDPWDMTKPPF